MGEEKEHACPYCGATIVFPYVRYVVGGEAQTIVPQTTWCRLCKTDWTLTIDGIKAAPPGPPSPPPRGALHRDHKCIGWHGETTCRCGKPASPPPGSVADLSSRLTRLRALAKALCDAMPRCEACCDVPWTWRFARVGFGFRGRLCDACIESERLNDTRTLIEEAEFAPALRAMLAELDGAE
jgi:hypothetical protein